LLRSTKFTNKLADPAEEELVKLTVAIAAINAWNCIAISFRAVHPARQAHAG
jgi:alkylhydroperoxidase family enzyme